MTPACRENMKQRIKVIVENMLAQAERKLDPRHEHKIDCFEYVIYEYICESNKYYTNDDALSALIIDAASFIKFVRENTLDL